MSDPEIYQLKITLADIRPPVWRRVRVPAIMSLEDLHTVIQCVMPWEEQHLYYFERGVRQYVPEFLDSEEGLAEPGRESASTAVSLGEVLTKPGQQLLYFYDLGDGWRHVIELEKILAPESDENYPTCIAGKRACPPEDCGGPPGYELMLKALADPSHPEHEHFREWIGEEFDPEEFDLEEANDILELEFSLSWMPPILLNRHVLLLTAKKALGRLVKQFYPDISFDKILRPVPILIPFLPAEEDLLRFLEDQLNYLLGIPLMQYVGSLDTRADAVMTAVTESPEKYYDIQVLPFVIDVGGAPPTAVNFDDYQMGEALDDAYE
ncbi:MAG: plasmid pRiA4b ORF-3 family protein [Caldilineae bacterium]|nr:MAG: plasmid pRiA4b ORF-3 family protein [Caldilineae bacterium]